MFKPMETEILWNLSHNSNSSKTVLNLDGLQPWKNNNAAQPCLAGRQFFCSLKFLSPEYQRGFYMKAETGCEKKETIIVSPHGLCPFDAEAVLIFYNNQ